MLNHAHRIRMNKRVLPRNQANNFTASHFWSSENINFYYNMVMLQHPYLEVIHELCIFEVGQDMLE